MSKSYVSALYVFSVFAIAVGIVPIDKYSITTASIGGLCLGLSTLPIFQKAVEL